MNMYRKRRLIAAQLCSSLLLALFVAPSARAQTPASASANDDRSEMRSAPPASCSQPSFAPSDLHSMLADNTTNHIDGEITRELDKAWRLSGDGSNGRESVVLIFRMNDGSYKGASQGFTNEYQRFTFKWNPATLAIIHTHPNNADPKPAEQDKRLADKYGVLNFTITMSGMYVYDPATKRTSKVLNGLDWLNLSTYPELKRWLGAQTPPPIGFRNWSQAESCRNCGEQC